VTVTFAGIHALEGVDLALRLGEILGLIGPNGAGKSTLLNAMTGFVAPNRGRVLLEGKDVSRTSPAQHARAGIARTFQSVRLFSGLTVAENVIAGAMGAGTRARTARHLADDLLERLRLTPYAEMPASLLPQGLERRVSLARALATRPRFLLLDEPAAGLDEAETLDLGQQIAEVRRDVGCGILVIEHDVPLIMGICDRIHVLAEGRTIAEGRPSEIRTNQTVIAAYLGAPSHTFRPANDGGS
jgi:branched-chain amino acid transport system ATP-binding protein